jgi:starvation-inducible DNA-binding protein
MAKSEPLIGTKNDIARKTRAAVVALLDARLLDAINLHLQAKQAHWNVKGPQFIALHELFDKVAAAADEATDLLAERSVQLGGQPVGAAAAVASGSKLPPYPLLAADGTAHVDALSDALARFGTLMRDGIDEADQTGDKDTADLFTEISREADKYLWFVEAHLEQGRKKK